VLVGLGNSDGRRLGVDLEQWLTAVQYQELAPAILSADEQLWCQRENSKMPLSQQLTLIFAAKEALYKHIHRHIQNIYQNFNVGISTGMQGNRTNLWHHRYRHWLFIPKNSIIDPTQHKANKK